MTTAQPIAQSERTVIVDVIRGFALTGVLIANFTGYAEQNVPSSILDAITSPIDRLLMDFNTVFIEWKFFTLFSILFGYGFGLILISLANKNISPNSFFTRRMFWLFVIGVMHALFWWGDVLHFYAISGMLLLLFRNYSPRTILIVSIACMFIVAPGLRFLLRDVPNYFTEENLQLLYDQYKNGNLFDVFRTNLRFNYGAFIATGADLHDITETLGRFLFGLFLLRVGLFEAIESKKALFVKILMITSPLMLIYIILRWMALQELINGDEVFWPFIMKLGILATTCAYVALLTIAFIVFRRGFVFTALQALGKMTLTNYLLISAFCVLLHYGIGFGQLGSISIHIIWILAVVWLAVEIAISLSWLRRFRFGPMEWIWRQLTYRKRIPLKR